MNKILDYKSFRGHAWLIWLVGSLFYGIEYLQRVSPTVMATPLMQTFHMNATTFSLLASLYFYAYALAQIPVGLLLDRFGMRRLLSLACALISVGSLLFALSKLLWILALARILIGFGSAFAFIGVLTLAANWFSDKHYPIMVGLTNTLGVVGAIFGQAPLAKLVEVSGWQHAMIVLSVIGFAISILMVIFIRDYPHELSKQEHILPQPLQQKELKKALKVIVRNKPSWITALYAGLMVVPIIAFGELWAVPFLTLQYHLSTVMAANVNAAIFIGIGIGGPVTGWLSNYFTHPRNFMLLGNVVSFILLLLIIYVNVHFITLLFILLFSLGFFTSSMLIAFNINKHRFPSAYTGTVAAFTNIVIVILGAIFQDILGFLLDHWKINLSHTTYNLTTYHAALSVLPVVSLACLVLVFFWHEKS